MVQIGIIDSYDQCIRLSIWRPGAINPFFQMSAPQRMLSSRKCSNFSVRSQIFHLRTLVVDDAGLQLDDLIGLSLSEISQPPIVL